MRPALSAFLMLAACAGPGPVAGPGPTGSSKPPTVREAEHSQSAPTDATADSTASSAESAVVEPPAGAEARAVGAAHRTETPGSAVPGPEESERSAAWDRCLEGLRQGKRWAELQLREEIATGERSAEAALALQDAWANPRTERYADALAVVDAALARRATPRLEVARAGLLRDLGGFDAARTELERLSREHPVALSADDWMSLAELWAYAAEPDRARGVLDQADGVLGADRRWAGSARARAELRRELHEGNLGTLERDVFAVLRGHEDSVERLRALQVLTGLGADRSATVLAAVALALDDRDPDVRAIAIRSLPVGAQGRAEIVSVALLDPDPEVRLAGAAAAGPLSSSVRRELLTQALSRESDPVVAQALRVAMNASKSAR